MLAILHYGQQIAQRISLHDLCLLPSVVDQPLRMYFGGFHMSFLRRARLAFSSCVRTVGKRLRMQRLLPLLGGSGLHLCSPLGDTSEDAIEHILQHFQSGT